MICKNCGKTIENESATFCTGCGASLSGGAINSSPKYSKPATTGNGVKFLPSFIIGLIGSIFGMMGGLCVTMCTSLYDSGVSAFLLIFGGSVVGLVGACKCLSDAKKGSIIELIGAIMIIICAFGITGADPATIIGLVFLLVSGIMGLAYSMFSSK